MNYLTGKPDELEPIALRLYEKYECGSSQGELRYAKCCGHSCSACLVDPNLYRVCPDCGADIDGSRPRPYGCTCGTIIWVCMQTVDPVVTRYITNPLFKMEEDII